MSAAFKIQGNEVKAAFFPRHAQTMNQAKKQRVKKVQDWAGYTCEICLREVKQGSQRKFAKGICDGFKGDFIDGALCAAKCCHRHSSKRGALTLCSDCAPLLESAMPYVAEASQALLL